MQCEVWSKIFKILCRKHKRSAGLITTKQLFYNSGHMSRQRWRWAIRWTHRCKAARRWCFPPTAETFQMSWNATKEQVRRPNPGTHDSLLVSQTHQQRATFRTVYPPPPSTSRGILKLFTNSTHSLKHNVSRVRAEPESLKGPGCERDAVECVMVSGNKRANRVTTMLVKSTRHHDWQQSSVSGVFLLSSVDIKALCSGSE